MLRPGLVLPFAMPGASVSEDHSLLPTALMSCLLAGWHFLPDESVILVAAALSYEDFDAMLNSKPPPKAKKLTPVKAPLTTAPQLKRPQGSLTNGQTSQSLSSGPAASSSRKGDAPVLSARPGGYWQKSSASLQEAGKGAKEEPPPLLASRPSKPPPPPAPPQPEEEQTAEQQAKAEPQMASRAPPQEIAETSAFACAEPDHANELVKPQKQDITSVTKASPKPRVRHAESGNPQVARPEVTKDLPPKLSKAQLFHKTEEEAKEQTPMPLPMPTLSRPAAFRHAVSQEASKEEAASNQLKKQAAVLAKLEQRDAARKRRQARAPAAEVAAKKAAAAKAAAKDALPPLQLISPPSRHKDPSEVDLTNPLSWGFMEAGKFALESSRLAERKPKATSTVRSATAQQAAPQLPSPALTDRPAWPLSSAGDEDVSQYHHLSGQPFLLITVLKCCLALFPHCLSPTEHAV